MNFQYVVAYLWPVASDLTCSLSVLAGACLVGGRTHFNVVASGSVQGWRV
jgi:hypothetical protein